MLSFQTPGTLSTLNCSLYQHTTELNDVAKHRRVAGITFLNFCCANNASRSLFRLANLMPI